MIAYPNVKVNLGLSVLRKRPDGYHDLETLFVPCLDIHDTLEIIAGDDFSRTSASLFERYSLWSAAPENVLRTPPKQAWVPPSYDAEGGTVFGDSTPKPHNSNAQSIASICTVAQFSGADTSGNKYAQQTTGVSQSNDAEGGTVFGDSTSKPQNSNAQSSDSNHVGGSIIGEGILPGEGVSDTAARIVQGIREDGKLMITIARKEGVDWDPLKDLTAEAYGLLDEEFGLPPVKIFLEKTSPVGAGLGGGSADAAFALKMLSELFALGLDAAALAARAARLGSDCAFFVYNRPMLGTGRGEVLEPFDIDLSDWELRVSVPEGVSVGTADAYRGITPREASGSRALPLREALSRPVAQWRDCLVNDFETTVFAKYPDVARAKQALYDAGAAYASMSGSGSAVYGLFPK